MSTHKLLRFVDDLRARIAIFPLTAIALAKASVDFAPGDPTPALIEETYLAGQLVVTDEVRDRFGKINALGVQTVSGEVRTAQLLTISPEIRTRDFLATKLLKRGPTTAHLLFRDFAAA